MACAQHGGPTFTVKLIRTMAAPAVGPWAMPVSVRVHAVASARSAIAFPGSGHRPFGTILTTPLLAFVREVLCGSAYRLPQYAQVRMWQQPQPADGGRARCANVLEMCKLVGLAKRGWK